MAKTGGETSDPAASFENVHAHRLRNLWRIRHYVRPYLTQMSWLLVAAFASTGASIIVPLVVRGVVDGPVSHGQAAGLLELGGLALALGVFEAVLIFIRRWTQSASALGMEAALRRDLYAHLQRLPIAFHDGWQSGQLLSRATGDLSVIRRFLSFGLIFLVVNTATYITVVALLIHLYWPLGLLVAASAVPLFYVSKLFTSQYFRASRMLANTWSQFDLIPNVTLALVLVVGALQVSRGELSLGGLVAFVSLQVMLVWPIDALGWIIANGQEAMTAADRVYEVL